MWVVDLGRERNLESCSFMFVVDYMVGKKLTNF